MDTRLQTNDDQKIERVYLPVCCCGLSGWQVSLLWGILLVLGGGAWLFDRLNLLPAGWLSLFWPLVLVASGGFFLWVAANRAR